MKAGEIMPIVYNKLLALMEQKGVTSYTMKKDNIIGQATFKKIKDGGEIDTRTISKLCALLDCQPGDIMEYVPDKRGGQYVTVGYAPKHTKDGD